jgi:predicted DCC family thiol-disulfide oxidoreductase YuxK
MHPLAKLTLFYDAACPLCQAEILFLSRRNQAGLLDFVDINSEHFDSAKIGISCDQALAAMYGQYDNGVLIQGVTVFSEAYRRADLPFLAWIFSRKSLQGTLQVAYRFFAKNRHAISRLFGPTALYVVKASSSKGMP